MIGEAEIYQFCMVAERSHGKKGNEELDCVEVMGELESNGGGAVNLMDSERLKAELMEGNEKLEKLWTEMELKTELMKKGIGSEKSQQRIAKRIMEKVDKIAKRNLEQFVEIAEMIKRKVAQKVVERNGEKEPNEKQQEVVRVTEDEKKQHTEFDSCVGSDNTGSSSCVESDNAGLSSCVGSDNAGLSSCAKSDNAGLSRCVGSDNAGLSNAESEGQETVAQEANQEREKSEKEADEKVEEKP